jgi:hypothetical protein
MALLETAAFDGQNFVITPVASPKAQASTQTWLIVLSGVAVLNTTAKTTEFTIVINPDVTGPINYAIANYGAPKPPAGNLPGLQVEQLAPYTAVGSIFDEASSTDAGFDVNTWRPNPFETINDAGLEFNQIFTGIQVDITARQTGSVIFRLPYNITLVAQIVSFPNPIVWSRDLRPRQERAKERMALVLSAARRRVRKFAHAGLRCEEVNNYWHADAAKTFATAHEQDLEPLRKLKEKEPPRLLRKKVP